jgi:hypothetical protein
MEREQVERRNSWGEAEQEREKNATSKKIKSFVLV